MVIDSGFFGTSANSILRIDDFLSKEELDVILYTAENLDIWDPVGQDSQWTNRHTDDRKLFNNAPDIYRLIQEIHKKLSIRVSNFYGVKVSPNGITIARWFPGNSQDPHSDMLGFSDNEIGSVIYLNENYEGGEIYFPQHDLEIKPSAGSAVVFPGDEHYMHGVREIRSGIRYALPIFWKVINEDK